jgi:hypothetical protein
LTRKRSRLRYPGIPIDNDVVEGQDDGREDVDRHLVGVALHHLFWCIVLVKPGLNPFRAWSPQPGLHWSQRHR